MTNPDGHSSKGNIWDGVSYLDDLSVHRSRGVSEEAVENKEIVSV
jgi:hypothetical protein